MSDTHVHEVLVDGNELKLEDVAAFARGEARVGIAPEAAEAVRRGREVVDEVLRSGRTAYGVNTGFGKLAEVRVAPEDLARLQLNLVRSHACGVGEPLSLPEARALMLLRANVLAKGHSGARLEVLEHLVAVMNRGIVPVVPEQGSVGASGDLAPLAHLALVLIGEGEAFFRGERMPGAEALRRAELEPLTLAPKEGLALINGTQAMTAVGTLALLRAESLARVADVAGALTLEGLLGSVRPFQPDIHRIRPQPGQAVVAENLRTLLADSKVVESHKDCSKVQDPYSLRCMPQVHGASRDALGFVRGVLEAEANSGTDNPLVFPDTGDIVSGGNFHGQPVAQALDFLAIGVAELGNISERRIEQLVNPNLSGLPAFLAPDPGLNSGFMMAQVTAAALVAENKVLCHPASVDSIPSSAGREDHVSMGMTAAVKARRVVENVRHILAIELMCGAQALEHRLPLEPGRGVGPVHRAIRERIPALQEDRYLHTDIETAAALVDEGVIERAARDAAGALR